MANTFRDYTPGLESPPSHLTVVTPSDTDDLATASRALNVRQSGFVCVTTIGGDKGVLFIAAGCTFPVRVRRVWNTGTTATGIVALY